MFHKSIVEYFSDEEGHSCGYCKKEKGSFSNGMWAHRLTVEDYEELINRGWRRSGKYCYKPIMNKTCCPAYPIRCDITQFQLSKSQKKCIKRVNKYLNHGKPDDETNTIGDKPHAESSCNLTQTQPTHLNLKNSCTNFDKTKTTSLLPTMKSVSVDMEISKDPNKTCLPKPGVGVDITKPPCRKAKLLRKEKWKAKHQTEIIADSEKCPTKIDKNLQQPSTNIALKQLLNDMSDTSSHSLRIELVKSSPPSQKFTETFQQSYQIYKKYQMVVHNDSEEKITIEQYKRFLVDSPLIATDHVDGSVEYGSFHQQYWIDGRLIAVGVLDILPNSVSSVYLFYDPDFNFLGLGTYSACREISFVQSLYQINRNIKYYIMGYYIHSCHKMRYKGKYTPSFLCCPEVYSWHPIKQCIFMLEQNKFSRLNQENSEDNNGNPKINETLILYKERSMNYFTYTNLSKAANDRDEISLYSHLVGRNLAKKILLYRD